MKYKIRYDLKLEYPGRTLYRIEALKDFNDVKKGDLGGYVEKEANLSQKGDCWIYPEAKVYDNAQVSGNALVYDNAKVYGDAIVYDNAKVYDNAYVSGNACVYCNARIYDNALVYGNAYVSGNAKVFGDAKVYGNAQVFGNVIITKTPKTISGLKHNITLTETHIFIGCEGHTIEYWKKNIVKIGKKHDYTDKEIKGTILMLKGALMQRGDS